VNRDRREALITALMVHQREIGHTDPVLAIDMAYAIYAAVIRGGLVFGENTSSTPHRTQTMMRELKSALTQYLRGHSQPEQAGAPPERAGPLHSHALSRIGQSTWTAPATNTAWAASRR
jgi:hypothetical protein